MTYISLKSYFLEIVSDISDYLGSSEQTSKTHSEMWAFESIFCYISRIFFPFWMKFKVVRKFPAGFNRGQLFVLKDAYVTSVIKIVYYILVSHLLKTFRVATEGNAM